MNVETYLKKERVDLKEGWSAAKTGAAEKTQPHLWALFGRVQGLTGKQGDSCSQLTGADAILLSSYSTNISVRIANTPGTF